MTTADADAEATVDAVAVVVMEAMEVAVMTTTAAIITVAGGTDAITRM